MNELQCVYNFDTSAVRTTYDEDEVWFVLKDVCDILGIYNSRNVYNRLDEDEKGVRHMDTPGGKQDLQVVNEFGLYDVILRSDSDKATPFRRWVTREVLPTIRKQGYYSAIPDGQLAEALISGMNDADRLKHVIIPAMREANVDQVQLIADYMGIDPRSITQKMYAISDNNRRAKWIIDRWHKYNWGVFTIDDLPEPYCNHVKIENAIALAALDSARRSKKGRGHFTTYCGTVHFDKDGLNLLIKTMLQYGYIKKDQYEALKDWASEQEV